MSRKKNLRKKLEAQKSKTAKKAGAIAAQPKLAQIQPWMVLQEVEWRQGATRHRVSAKFSGGMTTSMKESLRRAAAKLEISMSEFERRLNFKNGIF